MSNTSNYTCNKETICKVSNSVPECCDKEQMCKVSNVEQECCNNKMMCQVCDTEEDNYDDELKDLPDFNIDIGLDSPSFDMKCCPYYLNPNDPEYEKKLDEACRSCEVDSVDSADMEGTYSWSSEEPELEESLQKQLNQLTADRARELSSQTFTLPNNTVKSMMLVFKRIYDACHQNEKLVEISEVQWGGKLTDEQVKELNDRGYKVGPVEKYSGGCCGDVKYRTIYW